MVELWDASSTEVRDNYKKFNKSNNVTVANYNLKKDELPHLDLIYDFVRWFPSDMYVHLPTLRKYASKCDTICEFGTNDFTSTIGLLSGFPKTLVTLDTEHPDAFALSFEPFNPDQKEDEESIIVKVTLNLMVELAKANLVDLQFRQVSSLEFSFNSVDLLFIDTLHTYTQLTQELQLHASKVKKYIILHDTEFYGHQGQDTKDNEGNYVCPHWETKGLGHALDEFLSNPYTGWVVDRHFEYCNGLTILKRPWIN